MSEKLLYREYVLSIARGIKFIGSDCWLTSGARWCCSGSGRAHMTWT